jgi:hypothetical protein
MNLLIIIFFLKIFLYKKWSKEWEHHLVQDQILQAD